MTKQNQDFKQPQNEKEEIQKTPEGKGGGLRGEEAKT